MLPGSAGVTGTEESILRGENMKGIVRTLYSLARLLNDLTTLSSGNPKKIARRAKNKIVGRWFWKKMR